MKSLRLFFVILLASIVYLLSPSHASRVNAVDPFEPFSKEGNPPEEYYYQEIFPLFRYIKPPLLKVYENRDRSREYQNLMICEGGDRRDDACALDLATGELVDDCTGGEVDICHQNGTGRAYTAHSDHGTCTAKRIGRLSEATSGIVRGECEYLQRPKVAGELVATDFSSESRLLPPSPDEVVTDESETPTADPVAGLIYPKLQNEACRYGCSGTNNPITWGVHRLGLSLGEQAVKQLMVVIRAAQTKLTLRETGEWPLGWVDWGYQTANGKTLEQIRNELPSDMAGWGNIIVEGTDDFFLNAGNLNAVSDVSKERDNVIKKVNSLAGLPNPPEWLTDLLQAPLYPPSFRQGYARGSVCIWDYCCPGPRCGPFKDALSGESLGLYADISVSQTFGAALDDLLLNHTQTEGLKLFRELTILNPLIRFAGSASPNAIPSVIHERMSREISDPCFKYIPEPGYWQGVTKWGNYIMDYAVPPTYLDPDQKCPGWAIQPEKDKEEGGAVPQSLLSSLISLIVGGRQVDEVEPVKRHLITIPDAMGQFISEIEEPVFLTRDTLADNEEAQDYNNDISNIVDATTDQLLAGKGWPVGDAKRRLALMTCADPDYSAPYETSIEAYALGTRNGCFAGGSTSTSACTGERFTELIGEVNIQPLPQAVDTIMSSKLIVDGGLNPELAEVYAQVEQETGVPCEILAGHHFAEGFSGFFGSNDPMMFSAANGGDIPKSGFLESVRNAALGVLRHPPTSFETMITSMSNFNGGGNSNCQPGVNLWGGCPRQYIGDDDPYATNFLDSRHTGMYLIYCGDFQRCNPPKAYNERPGTAATAIVIHSLIKNSSPSTASPSPSPNASGAANAGSGTLQVDPAGTCGDGFVDTGLGCIPYEREAFISALLTFLVGVSGLVALAVMLAATIQIMTAAGDAKKMTHGRELFGAGVTGLLFLVFSVTLLRIIAGDIIRLPGF